MWWRNHYVALWVSIERGDCPSMSNVWIAIVCDLDDLM